jgi:hypothetical protein
MLANKFTHNFYVWCVWKQINRARCFNRVVLAEKSHLAGELFVVTGDVHNRFWEDSSVFWTE